MISLQDLHRPDKPVLFDGGMGSELLQRGLLGHEMPEIWNLENPGAVLDVHTAYVEAGAHVVQTNTFGANAVRFRSMHGEGTVKEAIAAACGLAREAADNRALVAGSVGPLGEVIQPNGPLPIEDARAAFSEAIDILLTYGIDIILLETMTSIDEAEIGLRQALIAGASVVGVSMAFRQTDHGPRTARGESPADAVKRLQHTGAHIIGANCGESLEMMKTVTREILGAATVPVIIQASAGIPKEGADGVVYPETPQSFSLFVRTITEMGVRLVGGCCGAGPEHIRQARKVLS